MELVTEEDAVEPPEGLANLIPDHARATTEGPVHASRTKRAPTLKQAALYADQIIWKDSIVAKLMSIGATAHAKPLAECHTQQSWARCRGCSSVRTFFNRCDNFFCPVCQPVLSKEKAESVEWYAREMRQPKHVVLTARNTQDITWDQVKAFKVAWSKLRRRAFARGWKGGVWAIEVTKEKHGWHLHLHALIEAHWIDKNELSIQWGKLMGQDFAIVCVKDVREKGFVKEVCKYTAKGSQIACWEAWDIIKFIDAFQGQRMWGVFGELFGKRTQWREWINSIAEERGACTCGCNNWQIYNDSEWQWYLTTHETAPATRPPPVPVAQMTLTAL